MCILIFLVVVTGKPEGDAGLLQILERAIRGKTRRAAEIVLKHESRAIAAAPIAADRIYAIAESAYRLLVGGFSKCNRGRP